MTAFSTTAFAGRALAAGRTLAFAFGLGALASAATAKEIPVGLIGPMSGPVAVYGTETLLAAQFALEQVVASGMLGPHKIKLISADTTANPGAAAQAVQRMIDGDEVMAVIGGTTSAETAAAIEVTRAAKIPQISPLAQDTALTQRGNPWFARITQSAKVFSSNAAKWTLDRHKAKSVYILARNDNYGQSLAEAFEATAKELGVAVVGRTAYEPTGREFKPILARVAEAKPEFVAIMGFYTDTALIVKQMAELGIKVPVFANTSPAIQQYKEIAGPASDGSYGAIYYMAGSIDTEAGRSFVDKWKAKFNRMPTQYEGMGYDVTMVLAEAIKRADAAGKLNPQGIRDAIFTIKDYQGATGPITITQNGDVERPLPFVQLVGGELKLDFLMK